MKEIPVILALIIGILIGAKMVHNNYSGFTCTQQRAVKDTMPQEFECIQWTKENENGELRTD